MKPRPAPRRSAAERRGRRGETLAAWYLRLKGWRIVGRRLKTPRGEIDLVARRGRTVAFVEVKWRASGAALDLALEGRHLKRVAAAAEVLAARYLGPADSARIDVLLLAPGRWPRHIVNAWQT
ncbi:MAG: YraN family protein [Novosphingobium sp.]|nr:YraN family protein [Novosphingobium sp.]